MALPGGVVCVEGVEVELTAADEDDGGMAIGVGAPNPLRSKNLLSNSRLSKSV